MAADRQARVEDVRELALGLPHVTVVNGARDNPVYQVGGRSFIFFRTPRPDAINAETGERLRDMIVFWVESEADKHALVQDPNTPFFTTPHFDGYPTVLVRLDRIGVEDLDEVVTEAWLARAPRRLVERYLEEGNPPDQPGNYVAWLHKREPVYAYRFAGQWYDIGDAKQLVEADNRMRRRRGLPERSEYSPS